MSIDIDGTDFRIQQQGKACKGNPFASHKYGGKSAPRYKLGIDILEGNLVWIQGLACYVADMLPTCRRHVSICRQILADIACRCDTEEAPTTQFISITTDKYKSAQTYGYLSYLRVFVFELKQQSRNCRHVGNHPTCCQMSCRFGHPADTTFSCVCDMTSDVSRHVADTTQNVAVWATKTTRRHPT
jgi:hypothetical protein